MNHGIALFSGGIGKNTATNEWIMDSYTMNLKSCSLGGWIDFKVGVKDG